MSRQNLYVLYDLEAESVIGQVLMSNRDNAAVRLFTELLANKENIVGQYPEHFELRYVGRLDTEACSIDIDERITGISDYKTIYTGKRWALEQKGLIDDSNAAASAIQIEQEAAKR